MPDSRSHAECIEIRCGKLMCQSVHPVEPPACTACNSLVRTGANHPSPPCGECLQQLLHLPADLRARCPNRNTASAHLRNALRETHHTSTATRCPPCRADHIHLAKTRPQAKCLHIHQALGSPTETRLARYSPSFADWARTHSP